MNMRAKPWHRIVDELLQNNPMHSMKIYTSLQNYYFTPIYNPRTGKSYPPRGRTLFPTNGEVEGYLIHSDKFYQEGHGKEWWHLQEFMESKGFESEQELRYNDEGYELRPIGWRPGTGYRNESSPEDVIYRTYDEAVEWIRQQERETYQSQLDTLLSGQKLYVYDIEYSGTIFEHPEYRLGNIPNSLGDLTTIPENRPVHDGYFWHRGYSYNPELREYVEESVPALPLDLLMILGNFDDGVRVEKNIFVNYYALKSQGVNAKFLIDRFNGSDDEIDYESYRDSQIRQYSEGTDITLELLIEDHRQRIEDAISKKITYQTSGIPTSFSWTYLSDYAMFFDMNPQISRDLSHLYPEEDDNYHDGTWQSTLNEYTHKSSDAWDCTEEMNVDTGAEYHERMLYPGCAGNNATYFTYPSGGNYPYYVEPVVLD